MPDLKFKSADEAASYAAELFSKYKHVAGLDECGRGPMAGPVVSACVVLPTDHGIADIKDSKKFSSTKKRVRVAEEIMAKCSWGIGICEHDVIDKVNIHNATHSAAVRALKQCASRTPMDFLICDGGLNLTDAAECPTVAVIKGDLWFEAIGAASIIAKVYRDNLMLVYHEVWPEYGFNTNQGYGTTFHQKAISEHGLTPIHRRTFGICRTAKNRAP